MPAVLSQKAQPTKSVQQHFWLRYTASLLLLTGLGFCLWKGAGIPPAAPASVTAPSVPASVTQPPASPPRPAIVIDPGHGGADPGTVGHDQFEKTWTLSIGLALAKDLRGRGWPVELTRTDDSAVSLIDRSLHANREPRLAFVSIHLNAGGADASGIETYFAWPKNPEVMVRIDAANRVPDGMSVVDERGRLLAEALQAHVCETTGARNRGVKNQPQLSVISRTLCPAVLVECGFLSHPAECAAIQTDEYRAKIVRGLADGIDSWLHQAEEPGFGITHEPAADRLPHAPPAVENP